MRVLHNVADGRPGGRNNPFRNSGLLAESRAYMKRLAVNGSILDPILSGLGVYTVNLIEELQNIHDDILVYSAHPNVLSKGRIRVKYISKPVGPAYGKRGHLRRLLWTQFILPKELIRDKVEALLCPIPEGIIGRGVPQYVVVHDVTPLRFPKEYRLQWGYYHVYVRSLLRKAQQIITVSEQTKSDVVHFFGIPSSRIRVVPGGCNHKIFHAGISPDSVKNKYHLDEYFLYVGNFHPHKNLSRLIQAFGRVAQYSRHQLVLVGKKDTRYFPGLQAEVEKWGIQERVVFLGYVPLEDLPGLYAGATGFILPSLYEGFGLSLVEAMACGVPVIAGNFGAMKEVVKDAGILVDPTNPQEIADAMQRVLEDSAYRNTLVQCGLNRAQQYSWRTTAKMISGVMEEADS
jgi:glycosyltransferase involved in cell wall biosynthesis